MLRSRGASRRSLRRALSLSSSWSWSKGRRWRAAVILWRMVARSTRVGDGVEGGRALTSTVKFSLQIELDLVNPPARRIQIFELGGLFDNECSGPVLRGSVCSSVPGLRRQRRWFLHRSESWFMRTTMRRPWTGNRRLQNGCWSGACELPLYLQVWRTGSLGRARSQDL